MSKKRPSHLHTRQLGTPILREELILIVEEGNTNVIDTQIEGSSAMCHAHLSIQLSLLLPLTPPRFRFERHVVTVVEH